MAFTVSPGPLPSDGTRIDPEVTLKAFVQGTDIQGFSADAFGESEIGFVYAATDPPASSVRNKSTRWFRQGEGVTYKWDVWSDQNVESGVTYGDWVAISNRKEAMIWAAQPVQQYATLWHAWSRDAADVIYQHRIMDNKRVLMSGDATHPTQARVVPPFWVAASDYSGHTGYIIARVLGYTKMQVADPAATTHVGCFAATDFDWRVLQFANPYTYSNAAFCSVTQSSASDPTRTCFLWGSVSHLLTA
jgi:hypothetical protein